MERILYHGGRVVVELPEIRKSRYTKDFGAGFYCTDLFEQAKVWSIRKGLTGQVSSYKYTEDNSNNIKKFIEDDEWLDFVVACRRGATHSYDIVEGPMADDKIFNFVDSFIDGDIPREVFWSMMKFNKPTHQISFHTERALESIIFVSSKEVVHNDD